MKGLLAIALVSALSFQALAAEDTSVIAAKTPDMTGHSYTVGVEPLWMLLGGIGLQGDVRLTERSSFGIVGMYIPPHPNLNGGQGTTPYKWSTYEVYVGPTFLLTGDYDQSGVYVSPAIGYTGASIVDYGIDNYSGSMSTFEGRFTGGYQMVSKSFKFTAGAGVRLMDSADITVKDGSGRQVLKQSSGSLGALALDLRAAYMF